MAGNSNLTDSARNKQDEFYTQISMIERELKYYRNHFKDKVIFCNCDDPTWSNFWRYFAINFEFLGLKNLLQHITMQKSLHTNWNYQETLMEIKR